MATPEAPADALLGQYAFANNRHDRGVPPEPDTHVEKILLMRLKTHFEYNARLTNQEVEMLNKMLESGWYEKVLARPTAKIVYRGMSGDVLWVQKTFPHINWESELRQAVAKHKPWGISNEAYLLNESGGTSWSVDTEIAKSFAVPIDTNQFSVICWAHTADNPQMLDATSERRGLSLVKGLADLGEKEVICLQKTMKCFKLEWSIKDPQEALSELELYGV